ncbi:DgyrCDS9004 [Dimorphilus gyrociliatus]|uniref:DgyrCDS9004 n=1 Tax=Dimorphilus gyrociliatus TaxID=2664684 RepID=A0A7I8W114_9ANNE|nr:DgyrCDS9004 [Dimorphilus gyrociliatus]
MSSQSRVIKLGDQSTFVQISNGKILQENGQNVYYVLGDEQVEEIEQNTQEETEYVIMTNQQGDNESLALQQLDVAENCVVDSTDTIRVSILPPECHVPSSEIISLENKAQEEKEEKESSSFNTVAEEVTIGRIGTPYSYSKKKMLQPGPTAVSDVEIITCPTVAVKTESRMAFERSNIPIHAPKYVWQCEQCTALMENEAEYKNHITSCDEMIEINNDTRFICPRCQNTFKRLPSLHFHLDRIHSMIVQHPQTNNVPETDEMSFDNGQEDEDVDDAELSDEDNS